MNERLKELAEQAGWSGLYTTYNEPTGEKNWEMVKESITVPVTTKQIERFAELIRQDEREACLACYSPDDTANDWADKIRSRNDDETT